MAISTTARPVVIFEVSSIRTGELRVFAFKLIIFHGTLVLNAAVTRLSAWCQARPLCENRSHWRRKKKRSVHGTHGHSHQRLYTRMGMVLSGSWTFAKVALVMAFRPSEQCEIEHMGVSRS